jgi:hypothetical protein
MHNDTRQLANMRASLVAANERHALARRIINGMEHAARANSSMAAIRADIEQLLGQWHIVREDIDRAQAREHDRINARRYAGEEA